MVDTSRMEKQATNYVKSKLLEFGFDVLVPEYDEFGGDLKIELRKNETTLRLVRAQCKGRKVSPSSKIEIPVSYVDSNFVVFVYLVSGDDVGARSYLFFPEDIRKWKQRGENFILPTSTNSEKKLLVEGYGFDKDRVGLLKKFLESARIQETTTLIIDAFALENAILETQRFYANKWPSKKLKRIDFLFIVKQILSFYDIYKAQNRIINVMLFSTPHNWIREGENIPEFEDLCFGEDRIRVFEMKMNGFVFFELNDYLDRMVNKENIILVASDMMYEQSLLDLARAGSMVTLVTSESSDLRSCGHEWGDIAYPIAVGMGLSRSEW